MKHCLGCKKQLTLDKFYKHKTGKDGLNPRCKDCCYSENKEHKKNWRIKNRKHTTAYIRKIRKERRWYTTYENIRQRCRRKNHDGYEHYGGRGIKCRITPTELKSLWFRDKAYLMTHPSIDRIDGRGDYTLKNCRYIQLTENQKTKKTRWRQ